MPHEKMAEFFDVRAMTYDAHMRQVLDVPAFYQAVASSIMPTDAPVTILDLGCGTGLELEYIFARAPRALVTGIDLSAGMLDQLRERFAVYADQLTLIQDSYLTRPFPAAIYQYACAVQTLHHLQPEEKAALFARIHASLQSGGIFIDGDFTVSPEEEKSRRSQYLALQTDLPTGIYHIDIPCAENTECALLHEAGFAQVDIKYRAENCTVFIARKS